MLLPIHRRLCLALAVLALLAGGLTSLTACTRPPSAQPPGGARLRLVTTTSVKDTGLLDALLADFSRATGYQVDALALASGQALAVARRGDADLLLVHSPADEAQFVADGDGLDRQVIMRNRFIIVGPPADPAGVRGRAAAAALRQIAARQALYLSRADQSGTHKKELELWQAAGVAPSGSWYLQSGAGQAENLRMAAEQLAYTLTDRATFLVARGRGLELAELVAGDLAMENPYSVIRVNPERFPHVNAAGARALWEYLTGPAGQQAIGRFGLAEHGAPLFEPAAQP